MHTCPNQLRRGLLTNRSCPGTTWAGRLLIWLGTLLCLGGLDSKSIAAQFTLDDNAVWASADRKTVIVIRNGAPLSSGIGKRMQRYVDHEIERWWAGYDPHQTWGETTSSFSEDEQKVINTWTLKAHTTSGAYNNQTTEIIHWKEDVYSPDPSTYMRTGPVTRRDSYSSGPPAVSYSDEVTIPGGYAETLLILPEGTPPEVGIPGTMFASYKDYSDEPFDSLKNTLSPIALGSGASRGDAIVPLGGYNSADISFVTEATALDQNGRSQKRYFDPPFAAGFRYWIENGFTERIALIDLPPGFGSRMEILTPTADGGVLVSRGFFPSGEYDLQQLSGRTNGVKIFTVQGLSPQADLSLARPFAIGMAFEEMTNDLVHVVMRALTNSGPGPISMEITGGELSIRWTGDFTLQSGNDLKGPWIDVIGASTGYPVKPVGKIQFFRLRSK